MSRGFFPGSIILNLILGNHSLMNDKKIQKDLKSESDKDFKKTNLDILTEENDRLLKSLKRPGGSYKAAWINNFKK